MTDRGGGDRGFRPRPLAHGHATPPYRDCLPEIKSRIQAMTMDVGRELEALGEPTTELSRATLGGTMLGLLSRFASTFQSAVEGRGSFAAGREGGGVGGAETLELYGGARINYIFSEVFGKALMGIDPFATLTDEEIRTAICNANGTRPALFVPEISFDLLVKRQISRLEQVGGGREGERGLPWER